MRSAVAVVLLVASIHATVWAVTQEKINAPAMGPLASISYTPNQGSQNPDQANRATPEQIRADLKVLAPNTRAIRTYSSTGGKEQIAPIAADLGLRVTEGAWLDDNKLRNQRELRSAIDIVRKNRNINAIVVGNETVYRDNTILFARDPSDETPLLGDEKLSDEEQRQIDDARSEDERTTLRQNINVAHLIKVIQRVKHETDGRVPVTTGEIWSVWDKHPELVAAVDFIAVHILPYWEGKPASEAVEWAMQQYDALRQKYPGKRIVIAEFGWPSGGYNRQSAEPGRMEQAKVVREFVARAESHEVPTDDILETAEVRVVGGDGQH